MNNVDSFLEDLERAKARNQSIRDQKKQLEEKLAESNTEMYIARLKYQIASTCRVLDFIHFKERQIGGHNMNTLITHCLNKLSGNIDGVEIDLDPDRWLDKKKQDNEGDAT